MQVQQVITKNIFKLHMILPPTQECVSVIGVGGTGVKKERNWYAHAEEGVKKVALINLAVSYY